jgi:hypothetical protein
MFRRIWQKPAKTSVWRQHQTRKKKTEGWVSPSTAGETQRSLLSWSVTSCCSTTLARLPRLPRLTSLALCLLAAALARGSAREAEGGREEWLRCARASDGERTTKSESTAAASFKLRLRHRRNLICCFIQRKSLLHSIDGAPGTPEISGIGA